MAKLTGDYSYITFALTTLDGVVNAPSSTALPQTDTGSAFLELPNGILAEWVDGTGSSPDNDSDKQYFKVRGYIFRTRSNVANKLYYFRVLS